MQEVFELQQLLGFAFEQTGDGDAGPAADHRRNLVLIDFFFQQPGLILLFSQMLLFDSEFPLQTGQFPVTELRHAIEVVGPLRLLDVAFHLFDGFARLAQAGDGGLFRFPSGFQRLHAAPFFVQF